MKYYSIAVANLGLLLCACDASYRDISSDPVQKTLIGRVCKVAADLRAHGVTRKIEREKKTDYISIWNPGFTGPEMTFFEVLAPNTELKVLAARECSNCLFDRRLEYKVSVTPEPSRFAGKPAYIRAESMVEPHVRCQAENAA